STPCCTRFHASSNRSATFASSCALLFLNPPPMMISRNRVGGSCFELGMVWYWTNTYGSDGPVFGVGLITACMSAHIRPVPFSNRRRVLIQRLLPPKLIPRRVRNQRHKLPTRLIRLPRPGLHHRHPELVTLQVHGHDVLRCLRRLTHQGLTRRRVIRRIVRLRHVMQHEDRGT